MSIDVGDVEYGLTITETPFFSASSRSSLSITQPLVVIKSLTLFSMQRRWMSFLSEAITIMFSLSWDFNLFSKLSSSEEPT